MTAHFIGGNISNQYNSASANGGALYPGLAAALGDHNGANLSQVLMVQGGDSQTTTTVAGVPVPFGAPAPLTVFNGAPFPVTIGGTTFAPGADITHGAAGLLAPAPTLLSAKMRFSIAMQSAGTSAPTSALILLRTPLTAR